MGGLEQQSADSSMEEALSGVLSSLDDYRGQFPELQVLEQELKLLEEALTVSAATFLLVFFTEKIVHQVMQSNLIFLYI